MIIIIGAIIVTVSVLGGFMMGLVLYVETPGTLDWQPRIYVQGIEVAR